MRFKKIMILTIILACLLAVSTVSAANNATDELTVHNNDLLSTADEINLQTATDNAIVSGDEKEDLVNWTVTNDKEIIKGCEECCIQLDGQINPYENGNYEIPFQLLIDGKKTKIDKFCLGYIQFNASKLKLGKHNYVLNFLGDNYYNPTTAKGTFEICDIIVNADEKYIIEADGGSGGVDILLPKDSPGVITIIMGEYTLTTPINYGEIIFGQSWASFYFPYTDFIVPCGDNNVTIKFNGKTISTYIVQTDYKINLNQKYVKYGNSTYSVEIPTGMDSNLVTITIDGEKQKTELKTYGENSLHPKRYLEVNTTKEFAVGNHTVVFTYAGDDSFTKKTFNGVIEVIPIIEVPCNAMREDFFTLTMPDDCDEDLQLYVKYEGDHSEPYLYKTVKASGDIAIPLTDLKPGQYFFDFRPLKSYKIHSSSSYFTLNPDISYPKRLVIGSDEVISIDFANHEGILTVYDYYGNVYKEVELIDGKANISLSSFVLPEGKQTIKSKLQDRTGIGDEFENGNYYLYELNVDVVKPKITLPAGRVLVGDQSVVSVDLPGMNGTLIVGLNDEEGQGRATDLVNGKVTVSVAVDEEGNHSYYAQLILGYYNENGNFVSMAEYLYNFDIQEVKPKMSYPNRLVIGSNGVIFVDFANHEGILTVYDYYGNVYKEVELIDGKAKISLSSFVLPEGKQVINVTFLEKEVIGNGSYRVIGSHFYRLNVDVVKPKITLPAGRVLVGDQSVVSVDLPGMNGTLIVGLNDEEGQGRATDLVNGKATVNVVMPEEGNYSYYAQLILGYYNENGTFVSIAEYLYNFDIQVVNSNKKETVIYAENVKTVYNGDKYIYATLKDSYGNPMKYVKVTVTFSNGKTDTQTTNKRGEVQFSTNGLAPVQKYSATITFDGNAKYEKSTTTVKVKVYKATPKITAKAQKFKRSDKKKQYTIRLLTNQNIKMKYAKVYIKVNGKLYSAQTNKKGYATFSLNKLTKKGKYKAKIMYGGNSYYNALAIKVKLTVK